MTTARAVCLVRQPQKIASSAWDLLECSRLFCLNWGEKIFRISRNHPQNPTNPKNPRESVVQIVTVRCSMRFS